MTMDTSRPLNSLSAKWSTTLKMMVSLASGLVLSAPAEGPRSRLVFSKTKNVTLSTAPKTSMTTLLMEMASRCSSLMLFSRRPMMQTHASLVKLLRKMTRTMMETMNKMKKKRNPKLPKCAKPFMKKQPSAKRHTDSTMDTLTTMDTKTNCSKKRLSVTSLAPSRREHTMKSVKSRSVGSPHWAEELPPPVGKSLLLHSLFLEQLDLLLTQPPYTLSLPLEERQTLPVLEETWHKLLSPHPNVDL